MVSGVTSARHTLATGASMVVDAVAMFELSMGSSLRDDKVRRLRAPASARRRFERPARVKFLAMSTKTRVVLVVLDGFGERPGRDANAISLARTPTFDALYKSTRGRSSARPATTSGCP